MIGVTLACCKTRKYNIPKNLLKKGKNVLAIRVFDFEQKGDLKDHYISDPKIGLILSWTWRFKHTAFYLASSIQKHDFTTNNLLNKFFVLKSNMKTFYSKPKYYSILYDKMIKPLIPYKIKRIFVVSG